jgi:hypothetical protein
MESFIPLTQAIREHFSWHEARITCLISMLAGLVACQSVNTYRLAQRLGGEAQFASRAQRIRRLLKEQTFDWNAVGKLLLFLSGCGTKKLTVLVDRTNWDFGTCKINFLVISVVVGKLAVPVVWEQLGKKGNSNTKERAILLDRFLQIVPPSHIRCLLGDREFIGNDWFKILHKRKIPYVMRLKHNLIATLPDGGTATILHLAKALQSRQRQDWPKITLGNTKTALTILRLKDGELLAVAHHGLGKRDPLTLYRERWKIEMLFACLKRKGFNLEDTHLTHKDRLEKIFAIAAIAAAWTLQAGGQSTAPSPKKTTATTHDPSSCAA